MLDEFMMTLDRQMREILEEQSDLSECYEIMPSNMRSFAEGCKSFYEAVDWAIFKMILDDGTKIEWIDTDSDSGEHLGPGPFRRWESLDVTVQFDNKDRDCVTVRRIRQC